MFKDRNSIKVEADFVDEKILKVGKPRDANTTLTDSFGRSLVQMLTKPKPEHQQQLPALVSAEDRVEFAAKFFAGLRLPEEVLKKYEKNSEISLLLRSKGTELYKILNFNGAVHYYTLALVFAEKGTQSVGYAYANRAAGLLNLGRFEEAIQDVDLALKNKYPDSQAGKLVERKEKCQKGIQKKQEDYLASDPKVRKQMEAEIKKIKKMRDDMLKVQKPNPLIPAAANFVEIKYDQNQGRYLGVNQDVPAGTVLIVEDPYMFALHGQFRWDTEHCHHCLKRIWNGIPCESCVFAIYCDETCRMEAKTLHSFECKSIPSFHAFVAADPLLKAIRIIFKVGAKQLFRIFQAKDMKCMNPEEPFGTNRNCVYDSRSYLSVFHLQTHPDKLTCKDRITHAAWALMATEILETKTPFFDDIPANRKCEFKNFVASAIVRHIEADDVNGGVVVELYGLENMSFASKYNGKTSQSIISSLEVRPFAGAIYPVASLINHSCDPNVSILHHRTNGRMVVMAHRALKTGEPLSIMYNGGFLEFDIQRRQAYVIENYYFKCHCIACQQNWPTLFELMNQKSTFCCPTCSKGFFEHEKGSTGFKNCLLMRPSWKCGSCGKNYKEEKLMSQLKDRTGATAEILRLLEGCRPTEACDAFLKVSDYYQFHLCPPNGQFQAMQELFRKTILLMFYFSEQL